MSDEIARVLRNFIKDLNRLQPEYSYSDRIWRIAIRTGKKPKDWAMAYVTHYQDIYYFSWTVDRLSLELDVEGKVQNSSMENLGAGERKKLVWALGHFHLQVNRIERDWVDVYRETVREYPLAMRYGIVPKSVIFTSCRVTTGFCRSLPGNRLLLCARLQSDSHGEIYAGQ